MTTITVNGTVDNPEPVYAHQEPVSPIAGAALVPNVPTLIPVKGFKNTGNMPMTCEVTLSNVQGITVNDSYFAFSSNGNTYGNRITLNPGFGIDYYVEAVAPSVGPGEDTSYSFSLDTVWTQA